MPANITNNTNPDNTVSVVVPAYNAEKFLARALDSILSQTRPPDEIIVVDDGSTDNTAACAQRFAPHARYIHQPNAGPSPARNTGIKAAAGRWLAFLDADDIWLPAKLERQLDLLQRCPQLAWAACNYLVDKGAPHPQQEFLDARRADHLLAGSDYFDSYFTALQAGIGWNPLCMIVERDTLDRAGLFCPQLRAGEDIDLWMRIAYASPQIGYVNQPLAVWHAGAPGSYTDQMPAREKLEWDFALFDRQLQLGAQARQPDKARLLVNLMLTQHLLRMYIDNDRPPITEILNRYRRVLPLPTRFLMRLLTLPFLPNTPLTRKLACRTLT